MASAYERPKEPVRVRQALLDCATAIAANDGLAAVTIAGVSLAAGVTKGALFHHFENKQALIDAMFDHLIAQLDSMFDAMINDDPVPTGSFTRAYVRCALSMDQQSTQTWSALLGSLIGGTGLAEKWQYWLKNRLRRHAATDGGVRLDIVRMAADGAWLNLLSDQDVHRVRELSEMKNQLIEMTKVIDVN